MKLSTATALQELAEFRIEERSQGSIVSARCPRFGHRSAALEQSAAAKPGKGTHRAVGRRAPPSRNARPQCQLVPRLQRSDDAKLTSFDDLYQRGNDAVDQLKSDQLQLGLLQQERPPDAAQIAEVKADIEKKSDEAFSLFQRALAVADAKADPEKLNFARYLLCYFNYQKQNYYEAAILGEYLAKKFPDSANARPAARVALAALDAIYRQQKEAGDKDLSFEREKIFDLAGYVTNRWADLPEADLALDLLISFYINAGDYDKGVEILSQIKDDSPRRPDAEIKLGQALWNKYLRTMQQQRERKAVEASGSSTAGPDDEKTKKELDALAKQSQEVLEHGIAGLRKQDSANSQSVLAALSLAQLYVALSQPEKAAALLEDPKIGPAHALEG